MILSEEWVAGTRQYLLLYHYDANGQPIGMSYRRSTDYEDTYQDFLFIKNIQGDITGIMDEEGNILVTYAYDAWGNHISTVYSNGGGATGAVFNPFRYRGYYYDYETCLYYLNSRYYDPASGRFINPDSASYIGADGTLIGYNLFAYCGNNPVILSDPTGHLPFFIIAGITLAIFGGILGYITTDSWDGALIGAAIGAAVGMIGGAVAAKLLAGSAVANTGAVFEGIKSAIGIVSKKVYPSWQSAEQALRKSMNSVIEQKARTFKTPYGKRIADAFNSRLEKIGESKYGYQGLSSSIRNQIKKDAYLLRKQTVKSVEWHFYWSQVSNSGGLSLPLRQALIQAGIKIIEHYGG